MDDVICWDREAGAGHLNTAEFAGWDVVAIVGGDA